VDMEKFLVNAAEYLRHFDVPNRSSKELSAWFNKYYWRLFEVTGESIPEKRARLKKELERIERRMVELEQILDPKEVWDWALAMSPLEQERIIEMLLDAFYDAEEIEMWAQTGLDPEQEMPGLNPGAAQQPAKDSDNWRDQCQAYALGVLADRNPQPTRMALAEETKETLNVPRGIRTIM